MREKRLRAFRLLFLLVSTLALCGFTISREYKPIRAKTLARLKIPQWYHEGLYFDGKDIWINNGKKGNTWVVDTKTGSIIKEIEPIGAFTEAITPAGDGIFFVTDWDAKKVYKVRIDNKRMIAESEMSVAPAHPAGAVWNGSNLYVVTWTRSVTGTKFHILKMDDKLNILSSSVIDKIAEPAHLAWDSKYLWVTCWYSRRVYKVGIEKFEILGYFKSPIAKTTGIAWDGRYFWVTGTYGGLYKMEVQN